METLVDRWNSLASSWWSWAWPGAWQAALVAGFVLLLLRFGRRWPAPLRYGLILVALLKFVTPPLLSLPTGVFSRVTVGESALLAAEAEVPAPLRAPAPEPTPAASATTASLPHLDRGEAPSAEPPSTAGARIAPLALAFALYLAGVLVAAAHLVRQALAIRGERRRARPPARALARQHAALARALGLARVPELRISRRAGPMAIGLLSRAVLVPQALARLGADERAAILAHELGHHRRRDLVVAWLTALVRALWWWHPGALALARAAREAREECCDELVLERGLVEREVYCRSLLRAACLLGIARSSALAAAYHEHPLGARFRRLFDERRSHRGQLSRPAWGLLAAAGLVLRGGILGTQPSLTDLVNGQLAVELDLRRIYAALLTGWLEVPSEPVLGGHFEGLPLLA